MNDTNELWRSGIKYCFVSIWHSLNQIAPWHHYLTTISPWLRVLAKTIFLINCSGYLKAHCYYKNVILMAALPSSTNFFHRKVGTFDSSSRGFDQEDSLNRCKELRNTYHYMPVLEPSRHLQSIDLVRWSPFFTDNLRELGPFLAHRTCTGIDCQGTIDRYCFHWPGCQRYKGWRSLTAAIFLHAIDMAATIRRYDRGCPHLLSVLFLFYYHNCLSVSQGN